MLTREKVRKLKEKRILEQGFVSDQSDSSNDETVSTVISFEQALNDFQNYLTGNTPQSYYSEKDNNHKRELMRGYVQDFVSNLFDLETSSKHIRVQKQRSTEFMNREELLKGLLEEIVDYGPITEAYNDPEIDEIRANGPKEIFVEKRGVSEAWNRTFNDVEHMERIIAKLIGVSKQRITPKSPMVNARTIEGYRVNATHSSISPYIEPAFVIRKFSKSQITPDDMITGYCFSKKMYELLKLIPRSGFSWITVGSTGSGKTTLNGLLVREISDKSRVITIENPSEMRLKKYSRDGTIMNDVLQYESVSEDDDSSTATMENLLINTLRQSPHWIGPGELRTPGEFATALRAAQTGHRFFTTLHAENDKDAIMRFLTAYMMVAHEPAELALKNICAAVKFIICQQKLSDGSRKVTAISQILGSENLTPITNPIYVFEPTDNINGKIIGVHRRVNPLKDSLNGDSVSSVMIKAGISRSEFSYFLSEPTKDETEEYA